MKIFNHLFKTYSTVDVSTYTAVLISKNKIKKIPTINLGFPTLNATTSSLCSARSSREIQEFIADDKEHEDEPLLKTKLKEKERKI